MRIDSHIDGRNIILKIEGRIDTTTSAQFQQELITAFEKGEFVILDFADVEYISSAGLRVLLLGEKMAKSKAGQMKLLHISDVVKEVLQMVGFASILTIE